MSSKAVMLPEVSNIMGSMTHRETRLNNISSTFMDMMPYLPVMTRSSSLLSLVSDLAFIMSPGALGWLGAGNT
jgi:hypothetical protein